MKIIKVKLHGEEPGECKTIFKETGNDKYYNRIESDKFGCWYTVYPSQGYWENANKVKDDVVFEITDGYGNLLFSESNGNLGAFKSIGKKARETALNLAEKLRLHSYDDWSGWLCADMAPCGYTGYRDNWLHYEPKTKNSKIIEEYMHLGIKFRIIIENVVHPICGKTWNIVYIQNTETDVCEAICGYHLDTGPAVYTKVKNLSQLKRFLTEGAEFCIVEHCRSKELIGERRRVNYVNTTGIYTIVTSDPEHMTLKANRGKSSFLGWSQSAFWDFRDDGVCALYSSASEKTPENLIIAIRLTSGN